MSVSVMKGPRIIVALDNMDVAAVRALVAKLEPGLCRLKIGKELFTREGPALVRETVGRGFDVFLDLKFHDIPNTVAQACRAAAELGVWMLNVHASGGRRMLEAAREGRDASGRRPLLTAVTLLTSLSDADIREVGYSGSVAENVGRLAALAKAAGLDGVVCSAQEATRLRSELGRDFVLVTPGIRPAGAAADDQQRIVTPEAALRAGAHYLVIGRPITQSDEPRQVLLTLNAAIAGIS